MDSSLDVDIEVTNTTQDAKMPDTIKISARGVLIEVSKDVYMQSAFLKAYALRWNNSNPLFLDYKDDEVHEWLNTYNAVSIYKYVGEWNPKKQKKLFWDAMSKVDGKIVSRFTKDDINVSECESYYEREHSLLRICGIVSLGDCVKKITIMMYSRYYDHRFLYHVNAIYIYDLDKRASSVTPIDWLPKSNEEYHDTSVRDATIVVRNLIVDNLNNPEVISKFYPL